MSEYRKRQAPNTKNVSRSCRKESFINAVLWLTRCIEDAHGGGCCLHNKIENAVHVFTDVVAKETKQKTRQITGMSDAQDTAAKGKKKKRVFDDDYDFFSRKKPKAPKPPNALGHTLGHTLTNKILADSLADTTLSNIPVKAESTTLATRHVSPENPHPNRTLSADTLSSEYNSQVFYSADEFLPDSPIFHPVTPNNSGPEITITEPGVRATAFGQAFSTLYMDTPEHSTTTLRLEHTLNISASTLYKEAKSDDDDDFFDPDFKAFFSHIAKKEAVVFSDEHERLYTVKVVSRVGRPITYEREITGDTTFGHLLDQLLRETLREYDDAQYWKRGVLVYIEGKSELKPFFKPSSLKIPRPSGLTPSHISCLYIPVEHVTNFKNLYPEFQEKPNIDDDDVGKLTEAGKDVYVLLDESGDETGKDVYVHLDESGDEANRQPKMDKRSEDKSQYFVIGLKGKDNKRIEAEVGPTTQIRSILKYYMQVKGIKDSTEKQGKIIFDDEELDLDAVVADTELEEDFEVQVHV